MTFLSVLALLIFAHMLADYPLQGDFLARAKNRSAPVPGFPWWQALTAHAIIHAGCVLVITGSFDLAIMELVAHWITDDAKCRGKVGINIDQAIHITCKVMWATLYVWRVQ